MALPYFFTGQIKRDLSPAYSGSDVVYFRNTTKDSDTGSTIANDTGSYTCNIANLSPEYGVGDSIRIWSNLEDHNSIVDGTIGSGVNNTLIKGIGYLSNPNKNIPSVIDDVLNILNDNDKIGDVLVDSRVGSFFFGPNQKISYKRFLPKGIVTDGNVPTSSTNHSFGYLPEYDGFINVKVAFYSNAHDTFKIAGKDYKGIDLIHIYLDLIEKAIRENQRSIKGLQLNSFADTEPIPLDANQDVYMGMKSAIFRYRSGGE